MGKSKDPPNLTDACAVIASRKRIGVSPNEALRESLKEKTDRGGWGDRRGRTTWRLALYRELRDGMLRAVFYVNEKPVVGLDFHRNSSRDARNHPVPPGYHWDVHPPLVAHKDKFSAELVPLTSAVSAVAQTGDRTQVDRAVLAIVCKFWHVRFEREPRSLLRRGRR